MHVIWPNTCCHTTPMFASAPQTTPSQPATAFTRQAAICSRVAELRPCGVTILMRTQSHAMHQSRSYLMLLFCLLTSSGFAQTWVQAEAPESMSSIACSADASKLVAAGCSPVYISTNSGISWVQTTSPSPMFYVASSADGNKLAAIGSVLCTSSDSGKTWTVQSNAQSVYNWYSIASSADGTRLAASGFNGFIYTSTNSGITWVTNNVPRHNWHSIVSSADGRKLAAVIGHNDSGSIYVSTNSGAAWAQTGSPSADWYAVASSADGNRLIAAASLGNVYTSTNGGVSWMSNSLPSAEWCSVASSADGNALLAATDRGVLYASTNTGTVWMSTNSPYPYFGSAASADGKKLIAMGTTGNQGDLYTLQFTPTPHLNLKTSSSNLAFSWTVPSTKFVVQQNSDLSTTNWVTLTNVPVLNLTNLQHEVIMSPVGGSGYYRLVTP